MEIEGSFSSVFNKPSAYSLSVENCKGEDTHRMLRRGDGRPRAALVETASSRLVIADERTSAETRCISKRDSCEFYFNIASEEKKKFSFCKDFCISVERSIYITVYSHNRS